MWAGLRGDVEAGAEAVIQERAEFDTAVGKLRDWDDEPDKPLEVRSPALRKSIWVTRQEGIKSVNYHAKLFHNVERRLSDASSVRHHGFRHSQTNTVVQREVDNPLIGHVGRPGSSRPSAVEMDRLDLLDSLQRAVRYTVDQSKHCCISSH